MKNKILRIFTTLLLLTWLIAPVPAQQSDTQMNVLNGIPFLAKDTNKVTSGKIFWVSSTAGERANSPDHGKHPLLPFSTVGYAISQTTANNGDVIYVMPNHAETISAANGWDFTNRAGVSITGLGTGSNRPAITFATAAAADIDVDAADVEISNMEFICNIASQTHMVDITANGDGFYIHHNMLREGSATGLSMVEMTGVADNVVIENNTFYAPTAGNYDEAILLASTGTRFVIRDNYIYGDWDEGGINNAAGNVLTLGLIENNKVTNLLTGVVAINLDSAVTGMLINNRVSTDTATAAIDPGSMRSMGNLWNSTGDTEGVDAMPAVDSDYNFIGVDDANNVAATTNVADNRDGSLLERTETIIATQRDDVATNFIGVDDADNIAATTNVAANEDGSILERLEQLQEAVNIGTGTSLPANTSVADFVGKGTATQLAANESLYSVLAGATGIVTYPAAAAPANAVSMAEVLRAVYNQTLNTQPNANALAANYFTVTADMTSGTWNTVASHEIATVTGMVRLFIIAQCAGALTSGGAATIQLGVEGSTAQIIASTTATDIILNEFWFDATPTELVLSQTNANATTVAVGGGLDVGYEIGTAATTGGSIIFHVWWIPLDATGAVAAGAGGSL